MKNLELLLLVLVPLLASCSPGPDEPGLHFYMPDQVDGRAYAPYDNDYGRRGGTPTN